MMHSRHIAMFYNISHQAKVEQLYAASDLLCLTKRWRLHYCCCCHLQTMGQADDVAESLQAIQAAVADFTAGAAGQRIADTFRPLITSRLANALVSVEGVEPGQETAVAQHVLAVGGVRVQQVFRGCGAEVQWRRST
jgi:hypothetical protein